ncbi:MAG: hypothetical protein HYY24_14020 [Verrucomicrobia bacterium]|nr:hypothetical protein [Verrucomicrobiota bacterium]
MFFILLLVTLLIALAVSHVTVRLFDRPLGAILKRIISEELSGAWHRYIKFAAYVVGISGGVRLHELERYVIPHRLEGESGRVMVEPLVLNAERWTLEVFRRVIQTLQSIAWMLLVVFIVGLLAYVLTKGFELKHARSEKGGAA